MILAVVAALVVLELAYVVFANAYLSRGLLPLLNRHPERLRVTYSRAWTWLPGIVHCRDLEIGKQNRHVQWTATVDRARTHVSFVQLLAKRLDADSLTARGMTLHVRFRVATPEEASPDAPPIEGFGEPFDPAPPPLSQDPDRRRWLYRFDDFDVEDVRDLWIGSYRFRGSARMEGSVAIQAGRRFELPETSFTFESGEILRGQEPLATAASGRLSCAITGWSPREDDAKDVWSRLSGAARLRAHVADVSFVDAYFDRLPWLSVAGGEGDVELDVRIDDGAFSSGSSASVSTDDLAITLFDHVARGDAAVTWTVEDAAGAREEHLIATFDDFTFGRVDWDAPYVRGRGLRAEAWARNRKIAERPEHAKAILTLPDARVDDFATFDRYLPSASPLRVVSGRAIVRGDLTIEDDAASGTFRITAEDVVATYEGARLGGALTVDAKLASSALDDKVFDLAGSRIEARDVTVLDGSSRTTDGWTGTVVMTSGLLTPGRPVMLDTRVSARLQDTRPIVAVYAEKKLLVRLFKGALQAKDVDATARLRLGDDLVRLDDLEVHGEGLDVQACLAFGKTSRQGVLHVDSGLLSFGLAFDGGQRQLTPLAGKRWYERHRHLCP